MSTLSKPRVTRKHKTTKLYTKNTYRKAFRHLMEDFDNRCAYSMVHVKEVAGSAMDVDHHDPRKKRLSPYENLFPAIRVCNGFKGDTWPTPDQEAKGIRFLNPCQEVDYGQQIFEEPETGLLVGTTPAARYHIDMLDLNHDTLVTHRRDRTILRAFFNTPAIAATRSPSDESTLATLGREALDILKRKIEYIPPPPA